MADEFLLLTERSHSVEDVEQPVPSFRPSLLYLPCRAFRAMSSFATALTPILVLILVGFGPKRSAMLREDAWSGRGKLTDFMLFPAVLSAPRVISRWRVCPDRRYWRPSLPCCS